MDCLKETGVYINSMSDRWSRVVDSNEANFD